MCVCVRVCVGGGGERRGKGDIHCFTVTPFLLFSKMSCVLHSVQMTPPTIVVLEITRSTIIQFICILESQVVECSMGQQ